MSCPPPRRAAAVSALRRLCACALAAALGGCVTTADLWQSDRGDAQVRVGDRLVARRGFALVACQTATSTFQFWVGGTPKRCMDAGAAPPPRAATYAAGTVVRVVAIKNRGMVDNADSLMLLKSDAWRGTVVADAELAQGLFDPQR